MASLDDPNVNVLHRNVSSLGSSNEKEQIAVEEEEYTMEKPDMFVFLRSTRLLMRQLTVATTAQGRSLETRMR